METMWVKFHYIVSVNVPQATSLDDCAKPVDLFLLRQISVNRASFLLFCINE